LIKKPERPWKDAVFHQFRRRAGISANGEEYMGYAMRTHRYHYIEWHSWNPETHTAGEAIKAVELYDLQKDPQETVNLAEKAGNQALIDRLSAKLDSGWRSARPPIN
jgi:iduronate 2-sulfatase